ncbi:MAG TPA: hypothetical protein VLD39_16750 [Gammaproteobacteria bacterium]|nr:hypothetical protein [Gammaproteobacteria bacterium]
MTRISLLTLLCPLLLCGCSVTDQLHAELQYRQLVNKDAFSAAAGIGVLTPSAATGQEADRQALGDALSETMTSDLSEAKIVPLPAMLSAVNRAGLAREYSAMFAEYEETGILERDALRRVGNAAGVRYVAKLNLGDFEQITSGRARILGVRFLDTRTATIRVHLEIWDTFTGGIVWQGNEELTFAQEAVKERPISFQQVASLASQRLVAKVGDSGQTLLHEDGPAVAHEEASAAPGACTGDPAAAPVLVAVADASGAVAFGSC